LEEVLLNAVKDKDKLGKLKQEIQGPEEGGSNE
jgi:hypothetical protein